MAKRLKTIKAVFETSPEYINAKELEQFTSSKQAAQWFRNMVHETKESFVCLHLDSKNRLLCADVVSTGSLTASIVHPREVFKSILLSSANAVIFVPNHPSGDTTPSKEDFSITTRLKECAKMLGIRLLDHIIVGEDEYYSFADRGEV